MRPYERLLKYVKIWTSSDPDSDASPSTSRQFDLAKLLVQEMKDIGIEDAELDENCYVYGKIPSSEGLEGKTRMGFVAHLDTAPDFSGKDVKAVIHENYDGERLEIGHGVVLDPDVFPHLRELKGKTLITSDGSTLLGADDKAGIAEILTMAERLIQEGRPHGQISIAFTPDEEIGGQGHLLDLEKFGAQFAYTVDGGPPEDLNYETFNAAEAEFKVRGVSVHPGSAKGIMINASLVAMEINGMLPAAEIPSLTEGYEGFFHLVNIQGNTSSATLQYIVRDHSREHFQCRLDTLEHIEKILNEKYGPGTVTLTVRQQYRNMKEKLLDCMHLVETAEAVMKSLGVIPDKSPIRGGTDGAQFSFRGLPCPNLGTGGYSFHGPMEHITAEGMDTVTEILLGIVERYAER